MVTRPDRRDSGCGKHGNIGSIICALSPCVRTEGGSRYFSAERNFGGAGAYPTRNRKIRAPDKPVERREVDDEQFDQLQGTWNRMWFRHRGGNGGTHHRVDHAPRADGTYRGLVRDRGDLPGRLLGRPGESRLIRMEASPVRR